MAPLGVFDVSVFFTLDCGAAQQAEPEEAGGEQHQRARFGGRQRSRSRQGGVVVEIPHQEALRRGAGADQLCAVVADTQEITVVGGDEQMPVPIRCGLVEFVAGVRIRKRGNGCPARGVELVYFVTAVEDDVVCRWVDRGCSRDGRPGGGRINGATHSEATPALPPIDPLSGAAYLLERRSEPAAQSP
jgi:hypothetical protein